MPPNARQIKLLLFLLPNDPLQRLTSSDVDPSRDNSQQQYNEDHNITPQSIQKKIDEGLRATIPQSEEKKPTVDLKKIPKDEYGTLVRELTGQMELASANLEFEKAAELRDLITEIREKM